MSGQRVLLVGDHPHRGMCGTVDRSDVVKPKHGPEMVRVQLDEPSAGVESCYAEAKDLQPVASAFGGPA